MKTHNNRKYYVIEKGVEIPPISSREGLCMKALQQMKIGDSVLCRKGAVYTTYRKLLNEKKIPKEFGLTCRSVSKTEMRCWRIS